MSAVRPASPGKTRTCPHCKAVILESSTVCPGCQHHLRFGSDASQKVASQTALQVEGKIRHPREEEPWEYSVVVYVRNERGEEISRHVINVGALAASEERVVTLQVEVMPPKLVVAQPPKAAAAASPLASARPPLVPPPPSPHIPSDPTARPKVAAEGAQSGVGPGGSAAAAPPAATRPANPPAAPLAQPLRPAKETLIPPKPGDPYPSPFGRGPKPR